MLTPAIVHCGQAPEILAKRQVTLAAAYERQPERFVHGLPQPLPLPDTVWINPPKPLHTEGHPLVGSEQIDRSVSHVSPPFSPDSR